MLLTRDRWCLYNERYEGPFCDEGLEIVHCGRISMVPGWRLPVHSHGSYEICLVTQGACLYEVGSHAYELSTGDLCLTKPGEMHSMSGIGDEPWGKLYIGFRNVHPAELAAGLDACSLKYARSCSELMQGFSRVIDEFRQPRFGSSHLAQSALTVMLYDILRKIGMSQGASISEYSSPVHNARDYIERTAYYRQPVREIAENVNLSESRLSHLFSEEMGVPVYTYVRQILMQRAARMLDDHQMSISEIADSLEFPSSNYFSTAFKKHWGVTPNQYRSGVRRPEHPAAKP